MTRKVRDPLHGLIQLGSDEWRAVDAPVFQRLRAIRQLAMTYLVYPGAVHTRFEHSLGVRHVAERLAAAVGLDHDSRRLVCAAALLHDIGHGPFSHVSEQVLDERSGAHGVHEQISAAILQTDPDIRGALGEELCDRAADVIALRTPRSVGRDIVSGPTDADKLDYLLRDSYFAGVDYGRFDLDRMIVTAVNITAGGRRTQLGFRDDGVWAVEGLLLARHHMHRQVYSHKTRVATDVMLTRAMHSGLDAGALDPQAYTPPTDEGGNIRIDCDFLERYKLQTDVVVLDALARADEAPVAQDLARRLLERRLLKRSVALPLHKLKAQLGADVLSRIRDPEYFDRERIADIETSVADCVGMEPHLVVLALDARTNPTYRRPGSASGDKDILFAVEDGPPSMLEWESEIFRDTAGEEHVWANLYTAPVDTPAAEAAKETLWQALTEV